MSTTKRTLAALVLLALHPEAEIRLPMSEPPAGCYVLAERWPKSNRRNQWRIRYAPPYDPTLWVSRTIILLRPDETETP